MTKFFSYLGQLFFAAILYVKTVINVCYCDSAYMRFGDHMDIFLNKLIQLYLNNTINLRHLTQRIVSCYIHKMAIVS